MDGMLSQDEINALLSGMDLSDSGGSSDAPSEPAPSTPDLVNTAPVMEKDESLLSDTERDAIGEVANISMGSSATTLY